MSPTMNESRREALWSLASLLPEPAGHTLFWETGERIEPGRHDSAVVVTSMLPDTALLASVANALRPRGALVLATAAVRPGLLARRLRRTGYDVERTYGLWPDPVSPEFVVCLEPAVTADFWSGLFRPWSTRGALAATVAGRLPALGSRAFPWLVAYARVREIHP